MRRDIPTQIDRRQLARLLEEGVQLVEVLPRPEYDWAHPPSARNIPLKQLDASNAAQLDRGRPVVVYCNDFQ